MRRKSYERNRSFMPGFKHKPLKKMRKNMAVQITKEDFLEFKEVQMSGDYNMFDPRAREMTSLSKDKWLRIMKEYSKLDEAWGNDEEE